MVRHYQPQNRYVKGARPEVTEEIVEQITLGMFAMVPATEASKKIGISRVTIAKYYDALFERLFTRAVHAMCQAPLKRLDEQLRTSNEMRKDPSFVWVIRTYMATFPELTEERLHEVLNQAHAKLYRDKKNTKIVSQEERVEAFAKKGYDKWPLWLRLSLTKTMLLGSRRYKKTKIFTPFPKLSLYAQMMRASLGLMTQVYSIGLAQTVTKVFFQSQDFFRECSKRHRSMSAPLFKRAFMLAFLANNPSPDTMPWYDPWRLLADLEVSPLDFSKSS